ncbi:MAG: GTP-binding protein [Ruminococcaceae bacterium]|nr:GTP-binding protein [Oscillospiraceae bacterium]
MKKKITIGILAHVDAGKTTLSEALLYLSGKIRTLGRVDHKNTYLDINPVERERGITIFSKQARFGTDNCDFILLDTPGHVDFSAETERTLALLDYAILVISASDGVQNHTRTLWQLLEFYQVPVFIFVNKTDIATKFRDELQSELSKNLSPLCTAFYSEDTKNQLDEKLAMTNEDFLESFSSDIPIEDGDIASLISARKLFPCLYGSALKTEGVEFLISALEKYTLSPVYNDGSMGAKIYKISRDGTLRFTWMKITSGSLSARDEIHYISKNGEKISEKIGQIRLYSGEKFTQTDSVFAGEICAVTGLSQTYTGQGLGEETDTAKPVLEPVLSFRIKLPEGCDPVAYFPKLKELEEEEPSLHLYRNDALGQIEARLMGEVQIDLIRRMIFERLGIQCELDTGKILYKEKIASKTVGVGHFEPLRHYAEVQLAMEPLPEGSGLIFDIDIPENSLDTNWQRLILSHLYEKNHIGTLTGATLTDTKITLVAGKAHQKHTEGGDFRQATLRAVRHGLMKAGCVLLEPYYKFRLEVPSACVGRAMADLQARNAEFEITSSTNEASIICGRAPVLALHDYTREVISYTRGTGTLSCTPDGYAPCHNADEIISACGYDPEADLENTPHSVFCAHGAGFIVPWNEVDNYKHLEVKEKGEDTADDIIPKVSKLAKKYELSVEEVEAIMLRTFGPMQRKRYSPPRTVSAGNTKRRPSPKNTDMYKRSLIVDGYNLIYSWERLKEIADYSLEDARDALMDILSNYVAYTKVELTLVFDAYLVKEGAGSDFIKDNYRVVYTKPDETADTFIEKMMHKLGPDYTIRVITGDKQVQFSAIHSGVLRMSAKEFEAEVASVGNEITEFVRRLSQT